MHWIGRLTILALPVMAAIGCGGPPRITTNARQNQSRPTALFLEKEISGSIAGQSLREPYGMALDRRRILYLVDAGNNRLVRFERDLTPNIDIGGFGSRPGLFDQPRFVSIDNDLNLMVSDIGNRRISQHDSKLDYVSEVDLRDDNDPLKFGQPSGIAVTAFGEFWVCDRDNGRIAVFDNLGRFDRFVGGFGYSGGKLQTPEKLVIGPDRNFYVCDGGNSRIVIYDEVGNYVGQVDNEAIGYPQALTFDARGFLWVIDRQSNSVFCLDRSGNIMLAAGSMIAGCAQPMKNPADLVFVGEDRLLISDTDNNRLLVCKVMYEGP